MVSRLTPQDATFHSLESGKNPVAIGSLAILDNSNGVLDYETLLELVEERLFLVPRYRMKVREVPFGLGAPVWIDDRDFDITYHVRRSALPKPGTREQLHDLVARLISRPFDITRPLWEMFLVEGLADNRVALFIKTSAALVDGTDALEIGHVILDTGSKRVDVAAELWLADDEPSPVSLAVGALTHLVTRPVEGVAVWRRRIEEMSLVMESAVKALSGMVGVLGLPTSSAPTSPLNATTSRNRRVAMASTDLGDYRRVRAHSGGSINDVILAVIAGALRSWLQSRGEPITGSTTLRAVVPMSVYLDESGPQSTVTSFLIDLPVGEPNPVIRLSHIAHATKAQGEPATAGHRAHAGAAVRIRTGEHACDERARRGRVFAAHVQPRDHQRARAAGADVRRRRADAGDVPGVAAAAQPGAEHRNHLLRRQGLLRFQRRP